jgi:hypothetical protein
MKKPNINVRHTVRLKLVRSDIRVISADNLTNVAGGVPPPTKSGIQPLTCK